MLGNRCRSKNEHRSGCESTLQGFSHCLSPSIFVRTPSDRAVLVYLTWRETSSGLRGGTDDELFNKTARVHNPSRRRGGGVAARWACQQPTEERCTNFRPVAVIFFLRRSLPAKQHRVPHHHNADSTR